MPDTAMLIQGYPSIAMMEETATAFLPEFAAFQFLSFATVGRDAALLWSPYRAGPWDRDPWCTRLATDRVFIKLTWHDRIPDHEGESVLSPARLALRLRELG